MVRKSEHVFGPYKDRRGADGFYRYRVVFEGPDGRTSESFAGANAEAEARAFVADARAKLAGLKVSDAIAAFIADMVEREVRESSRASTEHRLRTFFQVDEKRNGGLLEDLTVARARALLEATKMRKRLVWVRGGHSHQKKIRQREVERPRSVAYRAGMLAEATTFIRWCAGQGLVRVDRHGKTPLDGLSVKGRRNKRKAQMRIDEIATWERIALERADAGNRAALAAVVTFYAANRAGETLGIHARDVDAQGTIGWVDDSKTESGRRRFEIPPHLQPRLLEAKRGKAPADLLFAGITTDALRAEVTRLCKLAGVVRMTTQGLRGLHATVAADMGFTGKAIALQLGHADAGQTADAHYAAPGSAKRGQQRRLFAVMEGGRA